MSMHIIYFGTSLDQGNILRPTFSDHVISVFFFLPFFYYFYYLFLFSYKFLDFKNYCSLTKVFLGNFAYA